MFLYFDRLTRFKYPEDKYFRVFSDIILKNLICPSINKKSLNQLETPQIIKYAKAVWNYSLEYNFKNITENYSINEELCKLEFSYYEINENSLYFLNSNLNFLPLIKELIKREKDLPINLKRICDIYQNKNIYNPIQKLILVEGITEDILLPQLAALANCDFDKAGYYIIVSGGKNQIVKQYTNWHKFLKLPVFILLDKDGEDVYPLLKTQLEKKDEIFMLKSGEFEDILDKKLILKTLKSTFPNIIEHTSKHDFDNNLPMVKNLENYFKINGLGEFKKADFAYFVKENCNNMNYLTPEIKEILKRIIKSDKLF